MIRGGNPLVAAALAAAALAPWPARADVLAEAERRAALAEQRVEEVERLGSDAEEPAVDRAARKCDLGEAQYDLGDWMHAAIVLEDAVDEPAFRADPRRPLAVFQLADSLRRQGACGAARPRYAEYLALRDAEHRAEALSGALECAVKEKRQPDVDRLMAEAAQTFRGELPPEVRYLAAKAAFQRMDLLPSERIRRAAAAFDAVGQPYQLQAWYFQGVLAIQAENLHGSLQWFDSCARADPVDQRAAEVRELCILALGRVHSQMGNSDAALEWYSAIPSDSPNFPEAMYELAWAHVRAKEYDTALRMASFVPELAPESPFAPEATVLEGNLLLRLGRFAEATDVYNRVINAYAPVRDEIDALLSMHEDPVRYFNELIGRQGKALDVGSVLPPVAVKWAHGNREMRAALELVGSLDGARREVAAAADLTARIDALIGRGAGVDAFPRLQRAFANAHAAENDAARIEGDLVSALSSASEKVLPPDRKAELLLARKERASLERRAATLPRTPEEIDARFARTRARIDGVERAAYQLGYDLDALESAIAASERWVDSHRTELGTDTEGRDEFTGELRKHRGVLLEYERNVRALRHEIMLARDAAAGADSMAEEGRLRAEYLEVIERERQAADSARGSLPGPERALFERSDAVRERLAAVRSRARALKIGIASDAASRASALRARVNAERISLAGYRGALDGLQAVSKDVVGKIAVRAIGEVRGQFYRAVLKADVGMVDVAWTRKRARLDKVQQLSVQKAAEIDALDREYKATMREAD